MSCGCLELSYWGVLRRWQVAAAVLHYYTGSLNVTGCKENMGIEQNLTILHVHSFET